ncbi:uncharacterized protein LOC126745898 [Anthonomus grandis grandis]|uniref:uncharacterized protein LOC126745898 n=1 Tax=Anthonomus grandis grandis TaxID=2921223 RepID=UPI0021657124|nr:uncharacterized protein LOC126745898 [Anthonomus grandis grandis]
MSKVAYGIFVVAFVIHCATAKGLPSFLKLCKRKDPNLHNCIIENVELLRPKLKQGVPELFIPPLDPLVIPEATLNSGAQFKATFKDIQMYNTDNFDLKSFDVDLDKHHINVKILFPLLRIKSIYNINGRLLVLNLDGKGPADGNYTNVEASLALKGTPFHKNNKEYVSWEKEKIDINIGKINLLFERLFGDNKELNERTNKVINENIDTIIGELQPVIQQVVSDFVFNLVNRIFAKYALSELFL